MIFKKASSAEEYLQKANECRIKINVLKAELIKLEKEEKEYRNQAQLLLQGQMDIFKD